MYVAQLVYLLPRNHISITLPVTLPAIYGLRQHAAGSFEIMMNETAI